MIEIVIILASIVVGIGIGALCSDRLRHWTLRIEPITVGESRIRYRYVLGADVGVVFIGLPLLICAIIFGNRAPTETTWPAFAFMGFGLTLYAIFALVSGYLCQTILIVTATKIQVYQQRGLGLWKRQRLMYDIVGIHYRKWTTRTGLKCVLLVDTRQQMNQRLMPTLDDETVAVSIKDEIISRQNLSWSSTVGKEEMFANGWWV